MAVKIELDKNKSFAMLPGFVIVGLVSLFILLAACRVFPIAMSVQPIALVVFSLLFASSSYFIYLAVKKLQSKKAGLTIDEEGFSYSATALGAAIGDIKWADIKELKTVEGYGSSYIAVEVYNPEYYAKRITSSFLRKQTENRIYKSYKYKSILLTLSANGLHECDFDELKRLLANKLNDYRQAQKNKETEAGKTP